MSNKTLATEADSSMQENNLMRSRFSFGVQKAKKHLSELKGRFMGKKMFSEAVI